MSSLNRSIETSSLNGAYSATVRLSLVIAGEHIPLAQVGGNRLYFPQPVLLQSGPAEVVVEVDGRRRVWPVTIPPADTPSAIIDCLDR
jgi:hypothetical protein